MRQQQECRHKVYFILLPTHLQRNL